MNFLQPRKASIPREKKAQIDARRELRKGFDHVINLITLGFLRPEEAMDYVMSRDSSPNTDRKLVRGREYKLKLLKTIPGIGDNLAGVLLREFGTLEDIANAKIEDIQMINGIGEKKAKTIKENINNLLDEYKRVYG